MQNLQNRLSNFITPKTSKNVKNSNYLQLESPKVGCKDKFSLFELISSSTACPLELENFMVNGVKLWIEGNPIEGEDGAEKSKILEMKESNLFLSKLSHHLGLHNHPITRPTRKAVQIGVINNIISIINPPPIDVGLSKIPQNPSINPISTPNPTN